MQMFEAVQQAKAAVHRIDVSGQIRGVDAERMNKFICALSHAVIPGRNDKAGHDARIVIKDQIGRAVEEEIRAIRFARK